MLFLSLVSLLAVAQASQTALCPRQAAKGIKFGACALPAAPGTTLECGTLSVPLDHDDPSGQKIEFGVSCFRAASPVRPATSLGSLVYNCGGPGLDCTLDTGKYPESAPLFLELVNRGYDSVIFIDPRGVGSSTRIKCDPAIWNEYPSIVPTTEAEFDQLRDNNARLFRSCLELTGDLALHADTMSAAKDLDLLRAALGDEKLNYLGVSYGTALGHTYAFLFPDKVGKFVFDGPVDRETPETATLEAETRALQTGFSHFIDACNGSPACPLQGQAIRQIWETALAAVKTTPAPVDMTACPLCKPLVGHSDVLRVVASYLWFPVNDLLGGAIQASAAGDGSGFAPLLANGTDDLQFAGRLIQCLDAPAETRSLDDLLTRATFTELVGPDVRQATQTWLIQVTCIGFPFDVPNPPRKMIVPESAAPALIVQRQFDSSTSPPWGVGLRHQYLSSRLVWVDNSYGHTSFLRNGTATQEIIKYLTGGPLLPGNTHLDTAGELY